MVNELIMINKFKKLASKFSVVFTENKFSEIAQIPRYKEHTIELFSHKLKIVDSASFLAQYKGIFKTEIYKFKSTTRKPLILDCGSNIGLSISSKRRS